jgi:solute carrier family 32 (vesicular inhibitory amino acid transporter)
MSTIVPYATPTATQDLQSDIEVEGKTSSSKWGRYHSTADTINSISKILCGIVGAGVVGLPYAISNTGWTGVGFLVLFGLVSGYTGITLSRCADKVTDKSNVCYADVGEKAMGMIGRIAALICQCGTSIGGAILYLILAGNLMNNLTHDVLHVKYWFIIMAGILVPFTWLRTLRELSLVAFFGMLASLLVVFVVIIRSLGWPDEASIVPTHAYGNITFKSVALGFGSMAFAFAGHGIFLRIKECMSYPMRFPVAVSVSYVISLVLYLPLAAVAYAIYGQHLQDTTKGADNILAVLGRSAIIQVANAMVMVHVMTAFVIFMNPVFLYLEEYLGFVPVSSKTIDDANTIKSWKNTIYPIIVLRTLLVGLNLLIAEAIPFFGDILSFVGASTITGQCFILPALFSLILLFKEFSLFEKIWNVLIIVIGLIAGAASSVFAIISIIDKASTFHSYFSS